VRLDASLPQMTARPDAAHVEAEVRGSWADMVHCFQQSMKECIKYNQENNNIY